MKRHEFNEFALEKMDEILALQELKGQDYATDEDRFIQFTELAPRNRCTPLQQLMNQLGKHMLAIEDFAHGKKLIVEDFDHRAKDVIVYLLLAMAMVSEMPIDVTDELRNAIESGRLGEGAT